MSLHTKTNTMQLPFTQLWYNRSKHDQKQNKVILKRNKVSKSKNTEKQPIPNKKRPSFGEIVKRGSQSVLNNISIDNLSNTSKQNDHGEEKKNFQININQNDIKEENSIVLKAKIRKKFCSGGGEILSERNNQMAPDKVLQIIQANVIPFMVDKFVDLQERMLVQITKMQQVIQKQKQQISKLQQQNNNLQQAITQINNKQKIKTNKLEDKIQQNKNKNDENQMQEQILTEQLFENQEKKIKQLNNYLQQLTKTLQQSKIETQQKIISFDKQIKKISNLSIAIEQKVQIQFAQRILQLISTYNDNFVDLDKRVANIEKQVLQENVRININHKNSNPMFGFKPTNKEIN